MSPFSLVAVLARLLSACGRYGHNPKSAITQQAKINKCMATCC